MCVCVCVCVCVDTVGTLDTPLNWVRKPLYWTILGGYLETKKMIKECFNPTWQNRKNSTVVIKQFGYTVNDILELCSEGPSHPMLLVAREQVAPPKHVTDQISVQLFLFFSFAIFSVILGIWWVCVRLREWNNYSFPAINNQFLLNSGHLGWCV